MRAKLLSLIFLVLFAQAEQMEPDNNKLRAMLLSIECMNTINEGLVLHHESQGCSKPHKSDYVTFLKKSVLEPTHKLPQENAQSAPKLYYPRIHTLFSTECTPYFDWQTVGLMHSFKSSGQPGFITRLLSCTDENLKTYRGMNLAPTHIVPSMSRHPLTGDWYVSSPILQSFHLVYLFYSIQLFFNNTSKMAFNIAL